MSCALSENGRSAVIIMCISKTPERLAVVKLCFKGIVGHFHRSNIDPDAESTSALLAIWAVCMYIRHFQLLIATLPIASISELKNSSCGIFQLGLDTGRLDRNLLLVPRWSNHQVFYRRDATRISDAQQLIDYVEPAQLKTGSTGRK